MGRIELNEQQMQDVTGGIFHWQYNSKGEYVVIVDGVGAYYADESAKRKINKHDVECPGLSDAEKVEWAISEGLLWEP